MTPSANTGPIVPAWIRDRISRHEEAWPTMALAAGMITSIAVDLALGVVIWTSEPVVYYARP